MNGPNKARMLAGLLMIGLGILATAEPPAEKTEPPKESAPPAKREKMGKLKGLVGKSADAFFSQLDKNGDGSIDEEEVPERMRQAFSKLDTDGDGKLSKGELQDARSRMEEKMKSAGKKGLGKRKKGETPANPEKPAGDEPKKEDSAVPKKADANTTKKPESKPGTEEAGYTKLAKISKKMGFDSMLKRFDTNADGKLALDEVPGKYADRIGRIDKDKDGFISEGELKAAADGMKKMGKALGAADVGPKQMFNAQDADADGRVSRAEAKGKLLEKFDSLDTNKDGHLDLSEAEKLPAEKSEPK